MFSPRTIIHIIPKLNKQLLSRQINHKRTVTIRLCSNQTDDFNDIFKHYSDHGPISTVDNTPLSEGDYRRFISTRSALRKPGITREITALSYKLDKEFISLAEGNANEEVFPFEGLSVTLRGGGDMVIEGKDLASALQYMQTQGMPQLLSQLSQLQRDLHRPPHWQARDILVTTGGQFGLYSAVDMLVEPGDAVLVPNYTYTGFHSVLRPYQPEIITIPEDEQGIIPEVLESILSDRRAKGLRMPRLLYLVPTGSNPSGTVLPEVRRRRVYELACRYDFLLLEDDPYMFMNYTDKPVPSFLSLDVQCRVVRVDSLSKVLSPGLRCGWVTAPACLHRRLELHLQADHLHACTLAQALLSQLLTSWGREGLASQLRSARGIYRARRDALSAALSAAGTRAAWHVPQAGMFLWLRVNLPDVHQMVFKTAFERGLLLVPGQASLFDSDAASARLRLAFSKLPVEDMGRAATVLADVLRQCEDKEERGARAIQP